MKASRRLLVDVCLCLIGVAALAQELDFSLLLLLPDERDTSSSVPPVASFKLLAR